MLITRLQLDVTGSAREQVLGPVLPTGFVATALSGELPARLDSDGKLQVQLRPGRWTVTLQARSVAPLAKVALTLPPAPWPRQEIWSYADDNALRSTRVEGQPTDAAQAGVPEDWSDLPAYVLGKNTGLMIAAGNRGNEGGHGDQLQLQRQMWLDFDGRGISVADHLSGKLHHHKRLEVSAPWQLRRASEHDQPLLITRSSNGDSGVEVREQQLDLHAGLRLAAHGGAIPAGGWNVALESIDATLHLPHGYRLLGSTGVDRSPDSWIAQWTLLDVFIVALVALLAGRLLGWPWALLAAGFLVLAQQQDGAPCWTLAVALALGLLARALPLGRLRWLANAGAGAACALAVLWTLPFAAAQLKYALHPQLERTNRATVLSMNFIAPPPKVIRQQVAPPPPAPPAPPAAQAVSEKAVQAPPDSSATAPPTSQYRLEQAGAAGSPSPITNTVGSQTDSRSLIQAGAGMPQWDEGNNYRLGWSGPVTPPQTARLVIAPAWLVRVLRVLMVLLLAALLVRLVSRLIVPMRGRWGEWRGAGVIGAALLALALLPPVLHAQTMPSQQLLSQLRARLTEAPHCAPGCATTSRAQLQVSDHSLDLALDTATGALVALPLPQTDDGLQLQQVSVDGHGDVALSRQDDRVLLRLDRGVHRVGLHYRLVGSSASLRFSDPPQRVSFAGQGWSVDGVQDNRMLGDSLTLRRIQHDQTGNQPSVSQSFPPYVRLTRRIGFGVDWVVENQVDRVAPAQDGFSVSLPLLPGEHPLGDGALVRNGHIKVTFRAGEDTVRWRSRLDHSATLSLTAPPLQDRAEVWEVASAPMWHVDASGVPTSDSDAGRRFQPLPGETLQIAITRPAAIAGQSLAFDTAQLDSSVGERATESTLMLDARSTRGGEHAIELPPRSELLEATRDGDALNLSVRGGRLALPLLPGTHRYNLRLRQPSDISATVDTPVFSLNAPAANIGLTLHLPQNRWVLWTWGPQEGPAVLYWSQLIVLLLVAWLLSRHAPTPLRFRHWLLLGLGFSAFAWSAYVVVVLWLIALGLRSRLSTPVAATAFNLVQVVLAALTLLALSALVIAVPNGLLGVPDMHLAGDGSSVAGLRWLADQSSNRLPRGGVFSLPLWVYKLAMLAWALWLANALIGWLRWAFESWSQNGYWRRRETRAVVAPPPLSARPKGTPNDA